MRDMIERLEGRRLLSGATHVDQSFTYDEPGHHFESHEVGVVTPSGNSNLKETSGYTVEIFEDGVRYTADADNSANAHFGPNSARVLNSTETSSESVVDIAGNELSILFDRKAHTTSTPSGSFHEVSRQTTSETVNGATNDQRHLTVAVYSPDGDVVVHQNGVQKITADGETTGTRTNVVFVSQNGEVRAEHITVRPIS